ncbi:MAG: GIY-YIG nuclease family protein [Propionibacteriales bacterium]|nr:GIY-YIG nuclease family protein [Propionibacteriales bacterium]
MSTSPEWNLVLTATRHPNATLSNGSIPTSGGVYAWFQDDECVYVGKASNLRGRLGKHRSGSLDLSRSTLRASVAVKELGVTRKHARQRPSVMTADEIAKVGAWFAKARVAWVECPDADAADALERSLRAAWMPPLNLA